MEVRRTEKMVRERPVEEEGEEKSRPCEVKATPRARRRRQEKVRREVRWEKTKMLMKRMGRRIRERTERWYCG